MRWGVGRWGGLALGGLVLSGCGLFGSKPPIVNGVQTGVASWYGPGFHGNRTANGEIYDQFELTAAHQSLPLGSRVMVTNLTNGRAVEVRINDRGPFVDNRIIDLSYAAARVIGMLGPGTARVRVEVLSSPVQLAGIPPAPPPPVPRAALPTRAEARNVPAAPPPTIVPPATNDLAKSTYTIEVASLRDPDKAEHLRTVLAHRFPEAHVSPLAVNRGRYYRVRIGPYPLRTVAVARAELVNRLGYPAIILEQEPGT